MKYKPVVHHYNHWLPRWHGVAAVTVGRHILWPGNKLDPKLLRHEFEHVRQYREHGVVGFLVRYFWHYLKGRAVGKSPHEAYRDNPFEQAARKAAGEHE